jgi:Arc/MetJ family transcription regulator
MRTTIDIPEDLLAQAMSISGARSKRDAIRWALEEALRHHAVQDLLSRKVKIDFAATPDRLEEREIREQYGKRSRRRPR